MRRGAWIVLCLAGLAASGCPAKNPPKEYPPLFAVASVMDAGAEPSYVIAEDFDKDGNADLAVTNTGEDTFSLYRGNGDGSFAEQIKFHTGHNPMTLAAADFNNDGLPDIATLNYADQNAQVYLNTGSGSFKNTGALHKPGKVPVGMAAGDVNKDGFPDIVVTLRYHKISIHWGRGKGEFTEAESLDVKGQPTSVVTGDYNNDGRPDIAVALAGSGNFGTQILWGLGGNKFEGSAVVKGGGQPLTIASLDANQDGLLDLVTTSNSTHALALFVNKGGKQFKASKNFASADFPKYLAAADFTGDGIPDLAVSHSTLDKISIMLGRGDGSFTYPPIFHPVDEYPQGMALGDFNNDGQTDIAVACRDKNLINILLKKNMINPIVKAG